jgi:hypothetical protein
MVKGKGANTHIGTVEIDEARQGAYAGLQEGRNGGGKLRGEDERGANSLMFIS